jgi:H+-translocating NAD(P) transhydrogenase subunit beta
MQIAIQLAYLFSSILFIIGIKLMNKTPTARRGNIYSSVAMFIAIIATLVQTQVLTWPEMFVCMLIGSAIGTYYAKKVAMTKMPEMVALFNGFGGLASLFVAVSDFWLRSVEKGEGIDFITGISIALSVFIGGKPLYSKDNTRSTWVCFWLPSLPAPF